MVETENKAAEPCGGCGETNPHRRCIGCLHEFLPKPPHQEEGEVVAWLSQDSEGEAKAYLSEKGAKLWANMGGMSPIEAQPLVRKSDADAALLSQASQIEALRKERDEWRSKARLRAEDGSWELWSDAYAREAVDHTGTMIRAEKAEKELGQVSTAIGSVRWMDPPDGGDVPLSEQVKRIREDLEAAESKLAEVSNSLTPSAETKAAYIGEFHERIEIPNPMFEGNEDDEPETIIESVPVSWTTIKEIMSAIRSLAFLDANGGGHAE